MGKSVGVGVPKIVRGLTITVNLKRMRLFEWRCTVARPVFALACWIMGIGWGGYTEEEAADV